MSIKRSKAHKITKSNRYPASRPTKTQNLVKRVALEQLAWKQVDLPDRLEDAEGFFGLEEIDGVEIAHNNGGQVEYIVRSEAQICAESLSDESEWEGFKDDELEATTDSTNDVTSGVVSSRHEDILSESRSASRVSKIDFDKHNYDISAWSTMHLSDETLSAIQKLGFTNPTPIQEAAIPEICAGRDVIGKAPTGSGKTLAFGVPILEHILKLSPSRDVISGFSPTAFIISPTRELAKQLETHLKALCSPVTSRARIATVTGGLDVHKQQRLLKMADIVIGTPGRLWDVFNSSAQLFEGLRNIKFLVIDEADRLLSSGHFQEVENLLHGLDRVDAEHHEFRQTLVFSATFQRDLQQRLSGKGQRLSEPGSMAYLIQKLTFHDPQGKPRFLDVNPTGKSQLAPSLKEAMLECSSAEKDLYLYATLLMQPPQTKTLIFANSINTVRQITLTLQSLQLPAHALHSQLVQKSRLKALERFAAGKTPKAASNQGLELKPSDAVTTCGPILVATDVAARGLDIPSVHLVIHYHMPRTADNYIHRSGRTARGNASGTALLLCSPYEVVPVRRLVAKVHAQQDEKQGNGASPGLRSAHLDLTMVSRLRPRVSLASKITSLETNVIRARGRKNLFREAAEDLGVDIDDEQEISESDHQRKGEGAGKSDKIQVQIKSLRAELRGLLSRRVNVGVSESYLTAGGMDIEGLLRGEAGMFIGQTGGLEID